MIDGEKSVSFILLADILPYGATILQIIAVLIHGKLFLQDNVDNGLQNLQDTFLI